ncbi:MAG: transketolase [Rhodothalassiaceae bacterium]|nr:MAG: transketolase [Rhodothalassiaceae bacterium]
MRAPEPASPAERTATVGHREMANAIRALAIDAVEAARSGHPGMPMGFADVATVLWTKFLRFDPRHPDWPDRDRFVLSAGHGSMLLYALLYLTGFARPTIEDIRNFRQLGSPCAGHPEYGLLPGVETTTGPLGQGLATAVGMAIAERMEAARNPEICDHRTWVVASDGDLMEGISHEAAALAGHLELDRLVVLFDDNGISIDGSTRLATSEDVCARFAAYGWETMVVDGHDPVAIEAALAEAVAAERPVLIACRTVIGYGAPHKAGTADSHGAPLGPEEAAAAKERLGWTAPPFEIPAPILAAWRKAGARGAPVYEDWKARLEALPEARRADFLRRQERRLPEGWRGSLAALREKFAAERPKMATRKASGLVLDALAPVIPELVGGSADLTGSNNTLARGMEAIAPGRFGGRYIHYGVREHAMAAAMNGMALHRGFRPYGGTFLVFSDYCRPAIRLAALMGQPVVHVMTHDSIGLGEDGPTHQPIEHLASLRAMPNLWVMRPGDPVETAECWELALARTDGPTLLALSRQGTPALRTDAAENRSARGAYVLKEASADPRVILIATGTEVATAAEVGRLLEEDGVPARVVSMPCDRLFLAQDEDYRHELLRSGAPDVLRVAIEAASPLGWERFVGPDGLITGLDRFGESAPAGDLYRHLGFAPADILARIRERL